MYMLYNIYIHYGYADINHVVICVPSDPVMHDIKSPLGLEPLWNKSLHSTSTQTGELVIYIKHMYIHIYIYIQTKNMILMPAAGIQRLPCNEFYVIHIT